MIMNPNGVVTQVMMKYRYSFADGWKVIAGKKDYHFYARNSFKNDVSPSI